MVATILVVDDSEGARGTARRTLERANLGLQVVEACDGAEALPLALSGDVDIVLADIVMPKLDGIELLRSIRQHKDEKALPVILVTSLTDTDTRSAGFDAGASDYLTKPFSAVELIARIKVQLRLRELENELRRADEEHRRVGLQDELTGLGNRRCFMELCQRELTRSRRHKFAMSVFVMGIDRFKEVNQRVGDRVGDAILAEMGAVVKSNLRTTDSLARLGGHRFAALLPEADAQQVQLVSARIHQAVKAHTFPGHDRGDMTASIGVASYPHERLESVGELMNAAEAAFERARSSAGDRIEIWSALSS